MTAPDAPFGTYAPSPAARRALSVGRLMPPGRLGLRLAGLVRPAALAGLTDDTADIEALGLKLRLHPRANLSEKRLFLTPQCFDPTELSVLRAAMGPGKQFVDIGANAGAYALVAALAGGPDARVLAVEPQSAMRDRLRFNAAANGLAIDLAAEALSDHEGEAQLRIDAVNRGRSALSTGDGATGGEMERVRVTTLSKLLAERGIEQIDAMKIDVEGFEASILKPFFAAATRALMPDLLIMEKPSLNAGHGESALEAARSAGYVEREETRMNVILNLPA